MITKTTNLDSAYSSLFDEIREKSNGNIDINNIEGFFGNIEEIAQLDNKKFLRLPLDEPMFKIDANARTISIPAEFRSNGLSVQGDHLAETVFFCIDRYFDYTDLSTTEISINWKMGQKTGKTRNFIMNKDILPGSIIFGWPINNVITEKSGALTFAVEFRKEQNGTVIYDFNTLTASINIKDGLVIDGSIQAVSLENDILRILNNSPFNNGDANAAVGNINWVTGAGLVANASDEADVFIPAEFSSIINLNTTVTNGVPTSQPIDLFAEGFVDNVTEIRYTNNIGDNIPVYLKVPAYEEDAVLSENQRYYVPVSETNPLAYRLATQEEIDSWSAEDEEDRINLYIRLAKLTINIAENYIVKAQGEKYINDKKVGAGEVASTAVVEVPAAKVPSAINIIGSKIEAPEGYSFDENVSNVVFLDNNNEAILEANVEVEDFGALQFTWQKKVGNDTVFSNMDEEIPYILVNASAKAIETEGRYKVIVKNFKNGTYADEVISDEWLASKLASPINSAVCKRNGIEVGNLENFNSQGSIAQQSVTLVIDDVDRGENARGEIAYGWMKGEDILANEIGASLTVRAEGSYTPIVKNIYNGSIFTKVLPAVFVNDIAND